MFHLCPMSVFDTYEDMPGQPLLIFHTCVSRSVEYGTYTTLPVVNEWNIGPYSTATEACDWLRRSSRGTNNRLPRQYDVQATSYALVNVYTIH